jgi:methyltransferase, FkbM family
MDFRNIEEEVIYGKLLGLAKNNNFDYSSKSASTVDPSELNQYKMDFIPNEVYKNIELLEENRVVLAHRPIFSKRRFIGKYIVFSKKVVRKLLKWYINPITDQQTRFNNAVTPVLGRLTEVLNNTILRLNEKITEYDTRELENDKLKQELEESITNLNDGIKTQIENYALQSANKYFKDINEIQVAIRDQSLMEIEKAKSEMNSKYENLLNETEKYQIRISELEQRLNQVTKNSETNAEGINQISDILNIKEHTQTSFFDKKTYSQSGEDSIIGYILFVLGYKPENIRYLDLGANHAKELSNTYSLYKQGAKGVLVEANPELVMELNHYRYDDIVLNNAVSISDDDEMEFYILSGDGLSTTNKEQAEHFCEVNENIQMQKSVRVKTITVKTIIERFFGNAAPELLSIDIEGCDLDILRSLDFEKYRPLVIVVETIEYRPFIDIDIKTNDVVEYMNSVDYYEYAFTGINSIFIDKRFMKKRNEDRV